MSYHQLFPDPPPPPRPSGRHRQEAAPQPWHMAGPGHGPSDAPFSYDDHADLGGLRSAYRKLRRVATLTALGYFVVFLLLSGYAPEMMTGKISGGLTTGFLLGLVQLPVALAAIAVYERIARNRVDPLARSIREQAEAATAANTGRPERSAWPQPPGGARA
ncbi:DUF485 domain-containing protein [Streptomyces sp. NPDC096176]|uniref:DUF485 domain-containing protein n=1 Tax=Streptomyces sp. NPDC096176 TaxID=3366079 RepID=UPI0037FB4D8F